MEYCDKGDLETLIKKERGINESVASTIIGKILMALKYMHDQNLIHRDIKSENILFADNQVPRLGDFGLTVTIGDQSDSIAGTPYYMAPESTYKDAKYDTKIDIWSLGIVIYEMLSQEVPFLGDSREKVFERIRENEITWPNKFSEEVIDLLQNMLNRDPSERYDALKCL